MKKSKLRETIREIIKKQLAEAQPAPDTKPTPAPTITPDKPTTEPDEPKRRRIGRPDVEPKPKALSEQDILNKIVSRYKAKSSDLSEDLDLGHEDDEPHMLRADLYRIAKYAIELYKMLEPFDKAEGEVDFPQWWQEKIIKAKSMLVAAKHYIDFEMKEPSIDAALTEDKNDDKIAKYETYTYTLDGKVVKPEIAFYDHILKAELDGKLYRIGQPVNNKIELNPIKGKTGTYTESKKEDMNGDNKIDSKDYLLKRKAAIEKQKSKSKK